MTPAEDHQEALDLQNSACVMLDAANLLVGISPAETSACLQVVAITMQRAQLHATLALYGQLRDTPYDLLTTNGIGRSS